MAITSPTTFGPLLRRLRLAAGLTQEELAERAAISTRGLQLLERGGRTAPRAETVRLLADALGLSPEARAELIAAAHPELATPSPPACKPSALPTPPTPLVGREGEVAGACALLRQAELRLLTLTGPGGVGKTRLALAVAAEMTDEFPDAVVWVELAPIRDPSLVVAEIARALGVAESNERPLNEALVEAVAGRQMLLVLDNLEHLIPAAPLISDLLAASPRRY